MQHIINESMSLISKKAKDVLCKNGLTRAEALEPWIIGIKHDFPSEENSVLYELKDFIVKIRMGMISALKQSAPMTETTEVKKVDDESLQATYEHFLELNSRASNFVRNRGLLDAQTALDRYNAGDFGRDFFYENGKKFKATREYLQFYNNVLIRVAVADTEEEQDNVLPKEVHPFVTQFVQKNGTKPMFFILYEYLMHSEDAKDNIFAWSYGVSQENIPNTKEDLAKKFGISAERVRQIVKKRENFSPDLVSIMFSEYWKQYSVFNRPCIFDIESDEECLSIQQREGDVPDTAIVAALALNNYEINYIYKDNKNYKLDSFYPQSFDDVKTIALTSRLAGFKFQTVINEIYEMCNKPPKKDIVIPILSRYVTNASYWTKEDMPAFMGVETRALTDAIKRMIAIFCPSVIIENDEIHIAGIYDFSPEIEAILTENGNREPVPFANIMERLRVTHPDEIKFKDQDRFKRLIIKYEKFEVIGKTRTVAMKEWGLFSKGIPELVNAILSEATVPLSNDQITADVKARNGDYIDTRIKKNIRTALSKSHLHLVDVRTLGSYYVLDDSRAYDRERFRVWKKDDESKD